nr:NfeD family protein [Desulfovibrio sp. JC010]
MILIFFGFGCFAAAVAAYFSSDALIMQVVVFCIISVASLLLLRKSFMGWFQGQVSDTAEDGYDDSPEGALAEVCKDFNAEGYGQIRYRGSFWKAVSQSKHNFVVGDQVRIVNWTDKSKTSFFVEKI